MHTIDIYRAGSILTTIKPDNSAIQKKAVMGDNSLSISFDDYRYLGLQIQDYCTVFGERYVISTQPIITKKSKLFFSYQLNLVSEGTTLHNIQYLFLGSDNSLKETDFSLMGNADTFIDLMLANTQRIDNSWVKGEVLPTDYINITFSKQDCYSALAAIAAAFNTEFWLIGKTIHLVQKEVDTGRVFKQGKGNGLYEITPQPLDGTGIITRLYIYGSDKNLPPLYAGGATRLQVPGPNECYVSNVTTKVVTNHITGTEQITFFFDPPSSPDITGIEISWVSLDLAITGSDSGPNTSPRVLTMPNLDEYNFTFKTLSPGGCSDKTTVPVILGTVSTIIPVLNNAIAYVEKNVEKYGVIEGVEVFDDIYPHRTGTVSGVDATNPFVFSDGDMDFDLNSFLLPGTSAKVTFNTGQLAGYTMELSAYDDATKKFTMLINKDETALQIPSDDIRPAIGDTYVLVDIFLPQSYISAAEAALLQAAQEAIGDLSQQQRKFNIVFDPTYLKRKVYAPQIGDLIWLQDDQFVIDRKIRVVSTSRNLTNEYDITVDVADEISTGLVASLVNTSNTNTSDITSINNTLDNKRVLNQKFVGGIVIDQIPTTATLTGFSELVIENTTGIVHKKV